MWPLVLYAAADLSWAAALLLRPDRRHERPSSRLGLSAGAALVLFAYAQAHMVVLPDPFSLADAALRNQLVLVRALLKLALPVWAAVLAWRALTPYWKKFYARLSAVLMAWAVGQGLAFAQRSRPGYVAGGASDLGWIIPFLALAALALHEAARQEAAEEPPRISDRLRPAGSAQWLVAVAALVGADAFFGASGYPALDAARTHLTQTMVVVMTLILAAREIVMAREGQRTWRGRFPGDAGPSRWVRLMGSAVHELGSHLSSITAPRAPLSCRSPGASPRPRSDALRLHEARGGGDARGAEHTGRRCPSTSGGRERLSVNRRGRGRRGGAAAGAGARRNPGQLRAGWGRSRDRAGRSALRHVLVALLDRAAVAIRAAGPTGQVDIATSVRGGAVARDGGGFGPRARPGPSSTASWTLSAIHPSPMRSRTCSAASCARRGAAGRQPRRRAPPGRRHRVRGPAADSGRGCAGGRAGIAADRAFRLAQLPPPRPPFRAGWPGSRARTRAWTFRACREVVEARSG